MNATPEITRESFDSLPPKEQRRLAQKAFAWFCVIESLNPYFVRNQKEVDTIKIVVGRFMNGQDKTDDRTDTGA